MADTATVANFADGALLNKSNRYTFTNGTGGALVRGEVVYISTNDGAGGVAAIAIYTAKPATSVLGEDVWLAVVADGADDAAIVTIVSSAVLAINDSGAIIAA